MTHTHRGLNEVVERVADIVVPEGVNGCGGGGKVVRIKGSIDHLRRARGARQDPARRELWRRGHGVWRGGRRRKGGPRYCIVGMARNIIVLCNELCYEYT